MGTDGPTGGKAPDGDAGDETRELTDWLHEKFQGVGQYAYAQGLIPEEADGEVSWTSPHHILLAKVWPRADRKTAFWVIIGDVPTDHIEENVAADARAAARCFVLKWRSQATRVSSVVGDETRPGAVSNGDVDWGDVGEHLGESAAALDALVQRDELWLPPDSRSNRG